MPKVLIIDDNVDHIRMTSRVLTRKGYQVLTAADGETGLDLAVADRPDVILLDLGLPDVDGQTLVGWLRREPELEGVPIVAVTAWPDDVAAQMVAAYGFDGYISKPIQFALLCDQVAAYLSSDAS
ncbi:MAG: response regulator [Chloroflexi bacterium]|nr:response regulator [Chloroflexota bacterium]